MSALADLVLLRPAWLLALPVLALLGWALRRRIAGLGDWLLVADAPLLAAARALDGGGGTPGTGLPVAALSVAGIAVLALAGPAVERREAAAFRNLDGVVLVLDASPSMTGGAEWEAMRMAGRMAVDALGARPGGLVVYAGDAYVATDMTGDARELGQTLSLVDAATVPDDGSRPGRGLALAVRMLAEAEILAGDVILLSDGGGLGADTLVEAERITALGARLHVVAPEPAPPLAALAAAGGGLLLRPGEGDALTALVADPSRARLALRDWPLLVHEDLGRWLLLLALLPALLLFGRRA